MARAGWKTSGRTPATRFRMFAKNPGTTAVAVLSLALAIGPNATLFSVVDRMFLRPVTVQGRSQMFYLWVKGDRQGVWDNPVLSRLS